jgi:hypothetical protein
VALLDKLIGGAIDNPVVDTAMFPFEQENKYISRPLASAALLAMRGASYPLEQTPYVGDEIEAGRKASEPFARFGLESVLAPSNFVPMTTPLKAFRIGKAAVRGYKGIERAEDILNASDTAIAFSKKTWTKAAGKRLKGEAVRAPTYMIRQGKDNPLVIRYFYEDSEIPMRVMQKQKGLRGTTFSPRDKYSSNSVDDTYKLEQLAREGKVRRSAADGKPIVRQSEGEVKLPGVYLDASISSGKRGAAEHIDELQFIKAKQPLRLLDIASKDGKVVWQRVIDDTMRKGNIAGSRYNNATSTQIRDKLSKMGYDGTFKGGVRGDYNEGEVLIFDPSLLELVGTKPKNSISWFDRKFWLEGKEDDVIGIQPTPSTEGRVLTRRGGPVDPEDEALDALPGEQGLLAPDPIKQRFPDLQSHQLAGTDEAARAMSGLEKLGRGASAARQQAMQEFFPGGNPFRMFSGTPEYIPSLSPRTDALIRERGQEWLASLRIDELQAAGQRMGIGTRDYSREALVKKIWETANRQKPSGGRGFISGLLSDEGKVNPDDIAFGPSNRDVDIDGMPLGEAFTGPQPNPLFGISDMPPMKGEGRIPYAVGSPEEYARIVELQAKPIDELTVEEASFLAGATQKDIESLLSSSGMDAKDLSASDNNFAAFKNEENIKTVRDKLTKLDETNAYNTKAVGIEGRIEYNDIQNPIEKASLESSSSRLELFDYLLDRWVQLQNRSRTVRDTGTQMDEFGQVSQIPNAHDKDYGGVFRPYPMSTEANTRDLLKEAVGADTEIGHLIDELYDSNDMEVLTEYQNLIEERLHEIPDIDPFEIAELLQQAVQHRRMRLGRMAEGAIIVGARNPKRPRNAFNRRTHGKR